MFEIKVLLAHILTQFRFTKCERTDATLQFFTTGRPLLGPLAVFVGVERISDTTSGF